MNAMPNLVFEEPPLASAVAPRVYTLPAAQLLVAAAYVLFHQSNSAGWNAGRCSCYRRLDAVDPLLFITNAFMNRAGRAPHVLMRLTVSYASCVGSGCCDSSEGPRRTSCFVDDSGRCLHGSGSAMVLSWRLAALPKAVEGPSAPTLRFTADCPTATHTRLTRDAPRVVVPARCPPSRGGALDVECSTAVV